MSRVVDSRGSGPAARDMIWLFLSGWLAAALLCSFVLWCAVHLSDGLDELVEKMLKERR